eukprot:m.161744 g.161744  ORF g.161744 m.161744 type:complete len:61 (-) comp12111_c0_seq1:134-316(-)
MNNLQLCNKIKQTVQCVEENCTTTHGVNHAVQHTDAQLSLRLIPIPLDCCASFITTHQTT